MCAKSKISDRVKSLSQRRRTFALPAVATADGPPLRAAVESQQLVDLEARSADADALAEIPACEVNRTVSGPMRGSLQRGREVRELSRLLLPARPLPN